MIVHELRIFLLPRYLFELVSFHLLIFLGKLRSMCGAMIKLTFVLVGVPMFATKHISTTTLNAGDANPSTAPPTPVTMLLHWSLAGREPPHGSQLNNSKRPMTLPCLLGFGACLGITL